MLKAPQPAQNDDEDFVYQVCISGLIDKEPFYTEASGVAELTNTERIKIVKTLANGFAEPFCSFLSLISDDVEVKKLDLNDFAPRRDVFATSTSTLVGDAAHAMAMCKSYVPMHFSRSETNYTSRPWRGRKSCYRRCTRAEENGLVKTWFLYFKSSI